MEFWKFLCAVIMSVVAVINIVAMVKTYMNVKAIFDKLKKELK